MAAKKHATKKAVEAKVKVAEDIGKAITILGMGPSAAERRIDIEKYCSGTEVWSLNNAYLTYPHMIGKFGRFFELHRYEYLKTWECGAPCHFTELDKLGCEIWRTEALPIIRNQKDFDIVKYCRHFKTNYFLGSPSLMLMVALYEHDMGNKLSEIRSWGIDTSDPSHSQQRQSWAFWIRAAHDRGIKLTGTSVAFYAEAEKDEGLNGLRESVGQILVNELEVEKQKQGDKL